MVAMVEEVEVPQQVNYSSMTVSELKNLAEEKEIEGYSTMKKAELIEKLGLA